MSFKNFSAAQDSPNKDKPGEVKKTASAGNQPAARPDIKQDEVGPPQKP